MPIVRLYTGDDCHWCRHSLRSLSPLAAAGLKADVDTTIEAGIKLASVEVFI